MAEWMPIYPEDIFLIHSCLFRQNLIFRECEFRNPNQFTELSVIHIDGNLTFTNCLFEGDVKIIDSTVKGESNFSKCKFEKGINLFSKDEGSFGNVAFEGGLNLF